MNIYVCIKQVPDTETKIKLNSDQTWIDTSGIKWIVSPYDEFAIEEGLKVKAQFPESKVTIVSAGPDRVVDAIRTGLAMGADTGLHIELPETADHFITAQAISKALQKEEKVDLLFCGKEAIDDGAAQTAQLIAAAMDIPALTVILEAQYTENSVQVKREVEGGTIEVLESSLPAVIAAQKGLNEPRYASLPNIMKAKKKEVKKVSLADLGMSESDQKVKLKNFELPAPKAAGRKLDGTPAEMAAELVKILHEEVKVI
ncbi:MAG: electron transfer flavoprotein subunit beta [Bdellovibrionaceae bacterium]|nr:electron transfer flavoprotein subunit beta [Pseudobdellovibrionaceae bacterium]|tara:strand:- start:2490 stop:3263 length:774 start_codon:yes stop_codon:yes gene_type:complete